MPGREKEVGDRKEGGVGELGKREVCCKCCCHVNGFIIQTKRLKM